MLRAYCQDCERMTTFTQRFNAGMLLGVLITGGLLLFAMPFSPYQCHICGAILPREVSKQVEREGRERINRRRRPFMRVFYAICIVWLVIFGIVFGLLEIARESYLDSPESDRRQKPFSRRSHATTQNPLAAQHRPGLRKRLEGEDMTSLCFCVLLGIVRFFQRRGRSQPALTSALMAGVLLSGCATIVRGTSEELFLNSTPPGATAKLSMGQACTTPCNLNIGRSETFTVTFSKAGCDEQTVSVFPTLAGSGILLAGAGSLVGYLTDYGTGAVYSLRPNPAVTTLRCSDEPSSLPGSSSVSANGTAMVADRLQRLHELQDKGLITSQEYDRKRAEILNGM